MQVGREKVKIFTLAYETRLFSWTGNDLEVVSQRKVSFEFEHHCSDAFLWFQQHKQMDAPPDKTLLTPPPMICNSGVSLILQIRCQHRDINKVKTLFMSLVYCANDKLIHLKMSLCNYYFNKAACCALAPIRLKSLFLCCHCNV